MNADKRRFMQIPGGVLICYEISAWQSLFEQFAVYSATNLSLFIDLIPCAAISSDATMQENTRIRTAR